MKNYHLKALQSDVEAWSYAAGRNGLTVSQWVRDTLQAVVEGKIRPDFTEEQMVRGRDPNREEIAIDFQFRTEPEAVKYWQTEAGHQGLGVQEWCRQALDYAAETDTNTFDVAL